MFDKSQSFVATLSIDGHPVTLVSGHAGPATMATQLGKTEPTRFRFRFQAEFGTYRIQVDGGKHEGTWIGIGSDYALETTKSSAYPFCVVSPYRDVLKLTDFRTDVESICLQSEDGYFVQQRMDPLTAFDDPDVLFNSVLLVAKVDRGNGTYLAMEDDVWKSKPLSFNAPSSQITLNIIKREID